MVTVPVLSSQREADHDRDEDPRDPVGKTLDLRLAVLRLLDQPGHLRELGDGPDAGRAHLQGATDIHRRPDHLITGGDFDRYGLAGQHGRIDRAGTRDDHAVGGDLLPRTYDEDISYGELVDRNAGFDPIAHDADVLDAEFEQSPERGSGTARGLRFEVSPDQDEKCYSGSDFEIDLLGARPSGGDQGEGHRHSRYAGAAEEQGVERPAECRDSSQGDQRVHGRRAVPQVGRRCLVERPSRPGDYGCGQGQR